MFGKLIRGASLPIALTLTLVLLVSLAACTPAAADPASGGTMEMETEDADHEHEEGEVERVPNDGAVIRIVSPADQASYSVGEDIRVEVEVENFSLGEEENHWHVYVDGVSFGMVMGQDTTRILRDLAPGEHEVAVFLSIGTHEELEEGDSIVIEVME
jgi:hypothetical protein